MSNVTFTFREHVDVKVILNGKSIKLAAVTT